MDTYTDVERALVNAKLTKDHITAKVCTFSELFDFLTKNTFGIEDWEKEDFFTYVLDDKHVDVNINYRDENKLKGYFHIAMYDYNNLKVNDFYIKFYFNKEKNKVEITYFGEDSTYVYKSDYTSKNSFTAYITKATDDLKNFVGNVFKIGFSDFIASFVKAFMRRKRNRQEVSNPSVFGLIADNRECFNAICNKVFKLAKRNAFKVFEMNNKGIDICIDSADGCKFSNIYYHMMWGKAPSTYLPNQISIIFEINGNHPYPERVSVSWVYNQLGERWIPSISYSKCDEENSPEFCLQEEFDEDDNFDYKEFNHRWDVFNELLGIDIKVFFDTLFQKFCVGILE